MSEAHQGTDPANALESAARYLRGGLPADGGAPAGSSRRAEIERQFDCLYRWAKAEGKIGDSQALKGSRRGGREHDVRHHPVTGRFWKFTFPGKAGLWFEVGVADDSLIVTEADATPLEYLERLVRLREIFGVETRLE